MVVIHDRILVANELHLANMRMALKNILEDDWNVENTKHDAEHCKDHGDDDDDSEYDNASISLAAAAA